MKRRSPSVLLGFLALVACSGTTAPTPATLAGTWTLHTVNGVALPYRATFQVSTSRGTSATLEIISGLMVIRGDGTWKEQVTSRAIQGSVDSTATRSDSGTYRIHGDSVSLENAPPDFAERSAIAHGDKILVQSFPFFFVYKQK